MRGREPLKAPVQGFVYVGRLDDKWIAVVIDERERVVSLSLPKGSEGKAVEEAKSLVPTEINYKFRSEMDPFVRRAGKEVVEFVKSYLKGEEPKVTFELNAEGLSSFMKKVLSVVSLIPRGFVTCYGCVAEVIGNHNASRAVGNALARNPWPIIIPCHRVVRSDLTLGGYRGGPDMKRMLLKIEGVAVTPTGRVLPVYFLRAEQLSEVSQGSRKAF
jgi:methylated-DNA-[protein]-cysteine S-methyltransferase